MFPLAYSYVFTFFDLFYQVLKQITLPTHGRLQLTVQLFIFIFYGSILSCTLWCNRNHCGMWNWQPQRDSCTTLAGLWWHTWRRRSPLPSSWHISVLSRLWQAPNPLCRPWQARPQLDCSDRQTSLLTSPVYSYQYTLTVNNAVYRNSRGVPGLMCSIPR